ncbi:MAG: protein phosphatase 2C domain-containing protein [Spirochaetaceae bacterium]|nr:protein phosphatase 2C domain-containing protein [Spirochaetaceae bacterium]
MDNKRIFAVTVQGSNHLASGKECQDYSIAVHGDKYFYETCIGKDDTWECWKQPLIKPKPFCCMAIVADGHGGDAYFRSSRGSQFAAESARNCIVEFLHTKKKQPSENEVKQLVRSVIKTWNDRVQEDFAAKPFGNSELGVLPDKLKAKYLAGEDPRHAYGTTLIAAVITENYWFGFHIGDGRCTILNNDGSFSQPIPWDDRCFLNITSSICDDDAAERARVYIDTIKPIAIFVCSDGIEDSYPINDNDKYLAKFYRALAVSFSEQDFDAVYADIKETLPIMSKKGSGDDMSLACIFDVITLGQIIPILKRDMADQKKEALIKEAVTLIDEKASQRYSETPVEPGKSVNITG